MRQCKTLTSSGALALLLMLGGPVAAALLPPGVTLAAQQELVRQNGAEVESLDIAQIESQPAIEVAGDLYEGLTRRDNHSRILPGVAQSWRQQGPTRWIFHLRRNARWSNGDPLSAQDFVYAWQRSVDPKTATKYGIFFAFIRNGSEIMAGRMPAATLGVQALERYTLQVDTANPIAFLPDMLANPQMAPLHQASLRQYGQDFTKPGKLVSNGAYRLSDWVVNSRLVLSKNPYYWDAARVAINKVTYLPVEDEDSAMKIYLSGQSDTLDRVAPGSLAQVLSRQPQELRNNRTLGLYYYNFNNADPALRDRRVRQALSMVVDRQILTQKVLGEGQVPSYGLIVAGTAGATVSAYDWSQWPMARRVAQARQLLAAAGHDARHPLTLRLSYNTSEQHKRIALFLLSEWKNKLGVSGSMENQEFKVFLKTRHDGAYQVARNGWTVDYNDATSFLDLIRCGSDQNDSRYCNPQVDQLIRQGESSSDGARRQTLLSAAARLAMEDYPLLPLYQYSQTRMVKPWVGGWPVPNPMDHYLTQELYLTRH